MPISTTQDQCVDTQQGGRDLLSPALIGSRRYGSLEPVVYENLGGSAEIFRKHLRIMEPHWSIESGWFKAVARIKPFIDSEFASGKEWAELPVTLTDEQVEGMQISEGELSDFNCPRCSQQLRQLIPDISFSGFEDLSCVNCKKILIRNPHYSLPYTFFLLNGDMELYRNGHLFI